MLYLSSLLCLPNYEKAQSVHEVVVQSLAPLSGLRIRRCHKLLCRCQTWLGSGVAVAVVWAGSCSSDCTPSLGTSICRRCSPKETKDKKNLEM